MVLVGGPAMVEAVRTTQSTFGIWVIVAVAMISLAAWLVGVYIADSYQTRLSRQRRRHGCAGAGFSPGPGCRRRRRQYRASGATPGSRSRSPRRNRRRKPPRRGAGMRGRRDYYAAADYYGTADYKAAEKTPAGNPETRARGVGDPATGGQADAPTRPDLPPSRAPAAGACSAQRRLRPREPNEPTPSGTRCPLSAAVTPTGRSEPTRALTPTARTTRRPAVTPATDGD